MALPLVGRKPRHDTVVDQAAHVAWVVVLHGWGARVPLGILLVWLYVGAGLLAGIGIFVLCALAAGALHHEGRLEGMARHEWLHWRAMRIRATWDRTALDVGLAAKGRSPRIQPWGIRTAPTGLAVTVRPRGGEHEGQFEYAARGLELAWKAKAVGTRKLERGRIRFDVTYRSELAKVIPYPAVMAPWDRSSLPFGIDAQGRPVTMALWNSHLLLGGLTGAGKSGGLHVVMAGIAPLEHTALVLCDPKRVELQHWRDRASAVATDLSSIDEVLGCLVALVRRRFEQMETHRLRVLEPSVHHPHVVVVVDELSLLLNGGRGDRERQRVLWMQELASTARAAAVSLVLATQRPSAVTIPTQVRDQIPRRIAYATANRDASTMILGDDPAPAHLLSLAQPGTCYCATDGARRAVLARTYLIDDERIEAVAQAHAGLRVDPAVIGLG